MKKLIIVTGAKGNLGQAVVKKFLDSGYTVIATVSSGSTLGFMHDHPQFKVFALDVTDAEACKIFTEKVANDFKKIDGVLLLVGGFATGNIHSTSITDIEKMMQLNFASAYNLAQPVFEKMLLQTSGGRIIFVGSKPGLNAKEGKGSLGYALSKSLVFRLAEIINAEGKGKNITASVIVPGTMDTLANRKAMPDNDFSAWVNSDDVAAAMEFICSENANTWRETVLKIYGNS